MAPNALQELRERPATTITPRLGDGGAVDVNSADFHMRPQWQQRILLKRTDSTKEKDKSDGDAGAGADQVAETACDVAPAATTNGTDTGSSEHGSSNGAGNGASNGAHDTHALDERRQLSLQRSKLEDKVRRTRWVQRD